MRRMAVLVGALLIGLITGCGVGPEPAPERLTIPAPPAMDIGVQPETDGRELTLYFIRGADLAAVPRLTAQADADAALSALSEGPTRGEVLSGLRTALSPQMLSAERRLGGLTAVSVTREFTEVAGGNQLLAVAQVVWTLTELPGVSQVRFLVDGMPVEVPTDQGLTDQPVRREDYRSAAPAQSPDVTSPSAVPPFSGGTSPSAPR